MRLCLDAPACSQNALFALAPPFWSGSHFIVAHKTTTNPFTILRPLRSQSCARHLFTITMASGDKAAELMAKAAKKTQGGGGFFGMFSDPKMKAEQAAEMYRDAATQYKIAKMWKEAGGAYIKSAEQSMASEVSVPQLAGWLPCPRCR